MLQGKTIIVTGANSGIGLAISKALLTNGANVVALCHSNKEDDDKLKDIALKSQVDIDLHYLDLVDTDAVKKVLALVFKKYKRIDGLVNNCGTTPKCNNLFMMTKLEDIRQVFEVNFFSTLFLTQRVSVKMIANRSGSIVNITSIAALDGEPGQFEYVTSKAALIGMTKKLSYEFAPFNIRVNAIAPGLTDTKMLSNLDEKLKDKILSRSKSQKIAKPDAIANIVIFLLSDLSLQINGQILRADG